MKKVKAIEYYHFKDDIFTYQRIITAWKDENGQLWTKENSWNSDIPEWIKRDDLEEVS